MGVVSLLKRIGCFLVLMFITSGSVVDAQTRLLDQEEAIALLKNRLQAHNIYTDWTTYDCLLFWIGEKIGEKNETFFLIIIHEKHWDGCPGDPHTSPRVDTFRIHRSTGEIEWDNYVDGYAPDCDVGLCSFQTFLKLRKSVGA